MEIDFNSSKSSSSNFPPKSVKLNSLITIVFKLLQFEIINDLSGQFPNPFFLPVNEYFPILIEVSLSSPLISNVFTQLKELSPIERFSNSRNLEKSNIV